ncbi:MAG: cellulose synthase/poly-beta-1,6-N-acetylglucosamine synthase-like glycosyltransferase [Kiritimatiellia bacterium]|jgi:cellulose synthase/poly-beta-1,6-N-acetylglucosamine synthase-like glycosyltransferase
MPPIWDASENAENGSSRLWRAAVSDMLLHIADIGMAIIGAAVLLRWAGLIVLSVADWLVRQLSPLPTAPPSGVPWPDVAVIVPAYNETDVIEATVRSILDGNYPDLTVIIVDDGSTDSTWTIAQRLAEHPRVVALRQPQNAGKAQALNAGIASTDVDLVVTVDADTVLAPDAVRRMIAPFLQDPKLGAVASNLKVGNRLRPIHILQSLEYITGLHIGRRARDLLACITTVPGAAGGWRRAAIDEVGGYSSDTLIEDTDLTIAVQRAGWKVTFQPDAVAWTEAPSTWSGLTAQRTRWMFGYLQVMYKHRGGFFRHGSLGWIGLPDLLYRQVLVFGLFILSLPYLFRVQQIFDLENVLQVIVGIFFFDLLMAIVAYVEDRERPIELLWAPVQRVVWPLFMLAIFIRVLWRMVRYGNVPWNKLDRTATLANASQSSSGPGVVARRTKKSV